VKRRGFTLIEIITVIGILSIFFSIGIVGIKTFKERYKQIEIKSFFYEMMDMLSYGKCYCVSNKISGNINFIDNNDCLQVYVVADTKVVKTIGLRKILKLKPFDNGEEVKKISLNINQSGYVEPTTIKLINESSEIFKITVQVGGNVMIVKEGEN
jgi:prepilin-type N-terminal cleavage/methylation domain-containing protein